MINLADVKEGDLVVAVSLAATQPRWSSNHEMVRMVETGIPMSIRCVDSNSVNANGWTWHPDDLVMAKGYKKKKGLKSWRIG